MSDTSPRIRMQNLDSETSQAKVDETRPFGHNLESSSLRMKTLNLETEEKKSMNPTQKKSMFMIVAGIAVIAGLGTGYGAFKLQAKSGSSAANSPQATQQVAGDVIKVGDVFGVKDDQTFKDSAEGYLSEGEADGEGSHRLLREGGVSQTVHLTSSITDLDKMVGMKVKVWGETFKGQKAGWLMDVGRIQVVELDAKVPTEE